MRLDGKTVVVTGASSGIGRAAALAFAKKRCNLVLAARRVTLLEELATEIETLGVKALVVPTDVTDEALVERLIDTTIEHFGSVDVMINNAGSGLIGSVASTSSADAKNLFDVNFFSALYGTRAAIRAMKRQEGGVIINISSVAGLLPTPYHAIYDATKSAMNMLCRVADMELRDSGIRVSTVCPSVTTSEFHAVQKYTGGFKNMYIPIGAVPAERVADVIVRTAERPKPVVVVGASSKMGVWFERLFPYFFERIIDHYRKETLRRNPDADK